MLYRFGRFELDAVEFRLQSGGVTVPLEPKALQLLLFFAAHRGCLLRKQELLDELWPGVAVTDNALTRCITLLRRALADDSRTPEFIETVPRVGYRFVAAVTVEAEPSPAVSSSVVFPEVTDAAMATQPSTPAVPLPHHVDPAGSQQSGKHRRLSPAARVAGYCVVIALPAVAALQWRHHAVASVASAARASGTAAGTFPADHTSDAADALDAETRGEYQRGLYFLDRRNGDASAAAFRKVIDAAPNYAPGYAGLALALATAYTINHRAVIPEAEQAARTAIHLDPNDGDAYIALGWIQTMYTWQWREAEANLTRGMQLSPQNATGRIWYAVLLQSLGRQDAAIQQAERAVALAPLSFYTVRMQASILYYTRRYDDALRVLERAREMQPQRPNVVDNWIGWVDEQRGLYDDAVTHDLLALEDSASPGQIKELREAYQHSGWRAYWQTRLQQIPPESRKGCGFYYAGKAYLHVGDQEHALDALRDAAAQHCFWMGMIQVDPALDSLRQNARFQEIERFVLTGGNVTRVSPAANSKAPVR